MERLVVTDQELALRALAYPDELWAWLGPVKADQGTNRPTAFGHRWDFQWKFKRATKMEDIEFIVAHELLQVKANCWKGETFGPGGEFGTFSAYFCINKDGSFDGG